MLLQALDLLDRGLITRTVLSPSNPAGEEAVPIVQQDDIVVAPQANIHLSTATPSGAQKIKRKGTGTEKRTHVYQVRSSQPPKSRFRDASTSSTTGNVYTVRLEAWNCSCAAFTFSAFPSTTSYLSAPWKNIDEEQNDAGDMETLYGRREGGGMEWEKESDQEKEMAWEFGGLSCDGKDGGSVPVCKHLLACLLGEKWELLGRYVKMKEVEKEEMAGVGGED
jgi:hypothetical protein